MTSTSVRPTKPSSTKPTQRFFQQLEHPREIVSNLTPNWFASIMGTGIVANASASLPLQFPGLRLAGTIIWVIATIVLVALTVATILHWILYRQSARGHHLNPVISHFYGAPAMAFLTVGAGTLKRLRFSAAPMRVAALG